MNRNDLKLLVDCACGIYGTVTVGSGFAAAQKRLVRRRLIEEDPHWLGCVRITNAGDLLVEKLLEAAK